MAQSRERYHFIHNVFANFYKDMLDWFSTTIYPRFEYRVIGTYDKGVEYIQKQCQYNRETDMPMLPALILNPNGDFEPADANAGGAQYWRYPNLSPTLAKRLFKPIYRDDRVTMNASFIRIKGEIELIMLLNSFYEYCDVRMLFINMFGGLNRIIYPIFFSSFIILPDSFKVYKYENDYVPSANYTLDWSTAGAYDLLVRSTARNEYVLPLNIKPQISLQGLNDTSNRYGGADSIAEWKLGATINYEIEMPNYLVLETDYLAEKIEFEIRYGSAFSAYNDFRPPEDRMLFNYTWDWGLIPKTNNPDKLNIPMTHVVGSEKINDSLFAIDNISGCYSLNIDSTSDTSIVGDFKYSSRYFHEVTQEDIDSISDGTSYLYINFYESTSWEPTSLDFPIIYPKILIVNSKNGSLNYGDHYEIINDGWTLMIKTNDMVTLEVGWILELFVYRLVRPDLCEQ
ncbi:MAG TPA: hypothetical protein VMX17_08585 [Candidatus Glassbacteria bacterium]|nr:hypothetical protein [Candidatus Glassbacteria bacterium]